MQTQDFFPEDYESLAAYSDSLPHNSASPCHPYGGFVINVNVCAEGHLDAKDMNELCCIMPFGNFSGGTLGLHQPGIAVRSSSGMTLKTSSARTVHFNAQYRGIRGSIVFHTDREGRTWMENRNGWSDFIQSFEFSSART